ncbi:TetR/AcrR family transcriptional regulator [Thalassobacillus hwangdonensis]|uniref:TetR/AcrR family transcriptional regulator n=1 Tax=Thalassobacillus hwangdonensis TaxID=546108 RepID=A0ABW3KZY3_9BACI
MGRKKALSKEELFEATKQLLLERGVHGFHFKELSSMLSVSRSTIYEYYRNKEQLILAFMLSLMEEMNERLASIDENKPAPDKLFDLMHVFLEYDQIHQIKEIIHIVQQSRQEVLDHYQTALVEQHHHMKDKLRSWIDEAKESGNWRKDIETGIIEDLFTHAILFPQKDVIGSEVLARQLFSVIQSGMER